MSNDARPVGEKVIRESFGMKLCWRRRPCRCCGKMFLARRGHTHQACALASPACALGPPPPVTCVVCGMVFFTKHPTQTVCSECVPERYRQKSRERYLRSGREQARRSRARRRLALALLRSLGVEPAPPGPPPSRKKRGATPLG